MRTILLTVVFSLLCLIVAQTPVSTPYCWTCPSGWAHWWDFGYKAPTNGDQCQCIQGIPTTTKASTTTTKAPSTTTKAPATATTTTKASTTTAAPAYNCWTCSPGYVHWYDVPGMAAPSDKCACVPTPTTKAPTATPATTTKAPTTTVTTTKAATTTTKAPTTNTPISTPSCWTCPSGWAHWWDYGYKAPTNGDQCQCIQGNPSTTTATTTKAPSTTTKAPATTTKAPSISSITPTTTNIPISTPYCWTCPSGYSHWWDFGYTSPPGGDQCECIKGVPTNSNTPTTTNSPNSPTTTRAPTTPTAAPANSMQRFISLLTPNTNSPGSVSFSPYVAPYSPWGGPPMDLIDSLGSILVKQTGYRTVMIYYTEPYLVGSCVRNGLNVFGIISLGADANNNENLIQTAIATVQKYPNNMLALSCGNELGAQLGVTANTAGIINNCLTKVKAANLGIPVGVTDTFSSWTASGAWSAVANNADWIGANIYAWWDNVYIPPPFTCETPTNGPQITYNNYLKVQNTYPSTPVILTEFGWPSCGAGFTCKSPNVVDGSACATANDANQKQFVQSVIDIFRKNQKPCNTFEAFREAWKGTNSADINEYWGVCSGSPPYNCFNAPS